MDKKYCIDKKCQWLKGNCSISGKSAKFMEKCPYGNEEHIGFAAYDITNGTYVLTTEYKLNYVDYEKNNMVVFSGANLLKYYGKKIKIKVEVVE